MSTAIALSAFYDVDFCSNQNRRNITHNHHRTMLTNTTDHKAVGTPITGANRNRNMLERSMSEPADRNANAQVMSQQQQQNRSNVNSSRYKTELCRPFEENGYCKYGDKCQFAHGMHELRSLARHPKYKTELCRTFHTIGFCPYGPRCHFIHNEDERKLGQIDHMKQPQDGQQQQQPQQPHQSPQPGGPQQHPAGSEPQYGRLSPPQSRAPRYPLSLPIVRDSLGSAADSPTSSVTDSPIMSPTFVGDNDMLSSSFNAGPFANPPLSAPPTTTSSTQQPFRGGAFNFHELATQHATLMSTPLNIHTDPIASLTQDLHTVMSLSQQHNQRNNSINSINLINSLQQQKPMGVFGLAGLTGLASLSEDNLYAPPSPPDSLSGDSSSSTSSMSTSSMCGSPLEVSRGLRLPIFTSLSNE